MKTVTERAVSGKHKSSVATGARARIEVDRPNGRVRLEVCGESPEAVALIQQFVGALNGRTFDPKSHLSSPAFTRAIQLECVGLDDSNEVESVTLSADVVQTLLHVDDEHQRRATAFCQRHRHTTTTEAMDDLAAEFERVAREAASAALRRAADWCSDQSRLAAMAKTPAKPKGTDE